MSLVYSYSPLIRLEDKSYPRYLSDVKKEFPNVSFPINPEESIVEEWGYALVHESDKPQGDVVMEGSPVLGEDGVWYRGWTVRDYTQEEKDELFRDEVAQLQMQAEELFNSERNSGFSYTYEGEVKNIPVIGEYMVTLLSMKTLLSISDESSYSFKFADDTVGEMSKVDIENMLDYVLKENYNLSKTYWAFMAEISKATESENLPVLPDTFKAS